MLGCYLMFWTTDLEICACADTADHALATFCVAVAICTLAASIFMSLVCITAWALVWATENVSSRPATYCLMSASQRRM